MRRTRTIRVATAVRVVVATVTVLLCAEGTVPVLAHETDCGGQSRASATAGILNPVAAVAITVLFRSGARISRPWSLQRATRLQREWDVQALPSEAWQLW